MTKWRMASWSLILIVALGVPAAFAQQQKDPRLNPPAAPLPPNTPGDSTSRAADDPVPPQNAVKPDETPLSGAEAFTLGTSANARSYFQPSIRYTQIGDNQGRTSTGNTEWRTAGTMVGNISLQRLSGRTQTGLDYSGGATLFSTFGANHSSFHRLGLSEHISFRRATLLLGDSMTYLPESPFGAGGIGGISTGLFGGLGNGGLGTGGFGGGFAGGTGIGGLSGGGLIPGIGPNQSILSGFGRRISNTAIGQLQYDLGPRSSLTVSGSYGLLRFLDSGFISSDQYTFMAGYDYKLNKSDSIGLIYAVNMLRFTGITNSANFHNVHLAYGRRLTGRLALRLSGGPQWGQFDTPLGPTSRISWSARSSLVANFRSMDLGLNYSHTASAGSGVFIGADTDRVDLTMQKQLTRMWNGGLGLGYAHNHTIRQLNTTPFDRTVDTWHAGLHLQRPLTRQLSISFLYDVAGQSGNNPTGCTGVTCGRLPVRQHFALMFSWGFGPYAID